MNPGVRQSNIDQTICVPGWTATVRPPESITETEKRASLAAYGDTGPLSDYEYDHFVPLELGGATNDLRNLWPEPGASPNPKDTVELDLRDRVCSGQLSLARAQREIAANWVRLARAGAAGAGRGRGGSGSARCAVHAVFNSSYRDYDVYVRSNQPDEAVTVTGAGRSRSWHTDSAGSADVYFSGGSGERIAVSVGVARCRGTL